MTTWNTEFINRVKTGSIKNVVLYGDSDKRPAPPYVVVKMAAAGAGKRAQCYVHDVMGSQDRIEQYCLYELPRLFDEPLSDGGINYIRVVDLREFFNALAVSSDDNTISLERDFLIPVIY